MSGTPSPRTVDGPAPSGTVAFLFTDIEGSTARWDAHPAAMRDALARHDALLRRIIAAEGGHVFKALGDAFCAAFPSAPQAVAAALAAQRALAAEDFSAVGGVHVRAAIHAGAADRRDDDYFGPALNRCARLLSAAHGSQVLLSAAAAELASDAMPEGAGMLDLGAHRLKDLARPERVYQLVAAGLRGAFPALRTRAEGAGNLPLQTTPILGRAREQSDMADLLGRHRLVTLAGAGGVGKTRTALAVAASRADDYPDGAWFADLAALTQPGLVAETVARTLGLAPPPAGSIAAFVAAFLETKQALVVLDNCEHLIVACAELADAVVRRCPRVALLATSREPLGIPGEHVYRIAPLAVPEAGAAVAAAGALDYPAVQLFVERVRQSNIGFALTDANAGAIADICRRLDGIPLALELAAPALRMLGPDRLLAALDERFDVLTGGPRTALPRQRTLRAALDWSYDLLADDERTLLRRLSVFAGGCTLDAARSVCGHAALDARRIYAHAAALADKSLLAVDLESAEPRYRLLESTRQYAREKLTESGETGIARRHAAFMARLFDSAEREWPTTTSVAWLGRYAPELENLRAALEWSFGPGGDAALGVALFAPTGEFWRELELRREFRRWLEVALPHVDDATPPRVAARLWLGHAYCGSPGDPAYVGSALRAIVCAERAGDPSLCALAHAHASYLRRSHDRAAADAHLDRARALLDPLGRTKHLGSLLNVVAGTLHDRGEVEAAQACYREAMAIARELDFWPGYGAPAANLIDDRFNAGDVAGAIADMAELVDECRRHRSLGLLGLFLFYQGDYLLAADRHEEARDIGREGIGLNRSLARHAPVNACIETVALAVALAGDTERAARLAGYVQAFYGSIGFVRGPTQQRTWDRLMVILGERLPRETADRLVAEGAGWSESRAIAEALSD